MIQSHSNIEPAEPDDIWLWLRLLGWDTPLLERPARTNVAEADFAEGNESRPRPCRLGFADTNPSRAQSDRPLTLEEEQSLGHAIISRQCAHAKDRLFAAGLPTLARVVNAYEHRGLSTSELLEHGARGLRDAVNNYDPVPGVRFSTIASWWIKHRIKRAMSEHRAARAMSHPT